MSMLYEMALKLNDMDNLKDGHYQKKIKISVSVFVLLLAVLTSAHVIFIDALGARLLLQVVMCFLILVVITTTARAKLNTNGLAVIFLAVVLFVGELTARYQINKLAGYMLAILLVYTVLVTRRQHLIKFFKYLHRVNLIFAMLGIIALVLAVFYTEVYKALMFYSKYYNSTFPSGLKLLSLLGHADTWTVINGVKVPRVVGHLTQASLLPAYILLPLSIVLVYSKVSLAGIIVLLSFVMLTLGGTAYVAIFFAIAIYIFSRFVSRQFLVFSPFVFLMVFLCFLGYMFYEYFDPNNIKFVTRAASKVFDEDGVILNRLASGVARLMLISFAAIEHIITFPFPADTKVLSLTIGSNIITNGLRGGLFGSLLAAFLYYRLLKVITRGLKERRSQNRLQTFGFSLMYSLVFQAMVYNDFGFSTYYGLVMYACILVLSDRKNSSDELQEDKHFGIRRLFSSGLNAR